MWEEGGQACRLSVPWMVLTQREGDPLCWGLWSCQEKLLLFLFVLLFLFLHHHHHLYSIQCLLTQEAGRYCADFFMHIN